MNNYGNTGGGNGLIDDFAYANVQSVAPNHVPRSGRTPNVLKMGTIDDSDYILKKDGDILDRNSVLFIFTKKVERIGYKFSYVRADLNGKHLFRCNGCLRSGHSSKCSAIVKADNDGTIIGVYVTKHSKKCCPRSWCERFSPSILDNDAADDDEEFQYEIDGHSSALSNNVEMESDALQIILQYHLPSTKKLQKICETFQIQYQPKNFEKWFSIYQNLGGTVITNSTKIKDVMEISTNDYFACLSIFLTSSEDYGNQIKNEIKSYFCKKMMPETQDFELFAKVTATDELEDVHLDIFAQMTKLCVAVLNDGQLSTYGNMNKPMILLTKIRKQYVPVSEIEN